MEGNIPQLRAQQWWIRRMPGALAGYGTGRKEVSFFWHLLAQGKSPGHPFFPGWAEESAEQGKVYSHHSLSQERALQFHQEKR